MRIPLVDLVAQYKNIKDEVSEAIFRVIESSAFVGGKGVKRFEEEFAEFCETNFAVGVGTGTAAIHLALWACELKQNDEVIIPCHTFTATAEPIIILGAKPVFVDVEADSYNIDCDKIEENISEGTKIIMPVHLYGQPADMDAIFEIAEKHSLKVIEDAAQAHGARYKGRRAGGLAEIACFSFYPGKNLGAYGDAGMVVTKSEELEKRIRMLADHGRMKKYEYEMIGVNSRLDALQAAILSVKLKHLGDWNEKRRNAAKMYTQLLNEIEEVKTPKVLENVEHVFHLYVVEVDKRDELKEFLNKRDIGAGIHYPIPLHFHPAYKHLGYKKGDFPVTEKICDRILSLPLFPEITEEQISFVVSSIKEFLSS